VSTLTQSVNKATVQPDARKHSDEARNLEPTLASAEQPILIVDDEEPNRELLRDLLEASGYSVIEARDGEEALRRVRESCPGVILLDLMMPCIDGFHVCRELKRDPTTAHIPTLLLTSLADRESRLLGIKAGANDFLTKPIDREDLLLRVQNATFTNHLFQQLQQSRAAERELLDKTLTGTIKVLAEVLGLVNPAAFASSQSVTRYVRHVAADLGLPEAWRFEAAAMLSLIGCVTVDPEATHAMFSGKPVSQAERQSFARHHTVARQLLGTIPRLDFVAEVIGLQTQSPFIGAGSTPIPGQDLVQVGAEVLRTCSEFDRLIRTGLSAREATAALRAQWHESTPIIEALDRLPSELLPFEASSIDVENLELGMILDQDLYTTRGVLLVSKGVQITESFRIRLQSYKRKGMLKEQIRVLTRSRRGRA
jgi:CheY-like chemotaxis protein